VGHKPKDKRIAKAGTRGKFEFGGGTGKKLAKDCKRGKINMVYIGIKAPDHSGIDRSFTTIQKPCIY
jgi:hypothetical protein